MFKIFRRRKDKPTLTYGVMQYLSGAVERRQRKVADYLNGKTKSFGKRKWILFLCGFCLLFGSVAMIILYNSVVKKKQQSPNKFYPQSITIPSSVLQQGKQWDTLKMLEEIYRHRKDSVLKKENIHH